MPTYDYRCRKCGHVFELFHGIKDETPKRCPKCKGRAMRMVSSGAGILFKGSGFYITDYRSAGYKERAKQEKSDGAKGGEGEKPAKPAKTPKSGAGGAGSKGSD